MGKQWKQADLIFLGSKSLQMVTAAMKVEDTYPWKKSYDKPIQCVEKQRHSSSDKGPNSQGYGLSSVHVPLWDLDHKEGRVPKNWYLPTVVLEKTTESPLDSKEIKPVNLKANQPRILIGRIDAKAQDPEFCSSDANNQLIGKVPDGRKDWG